MNVLSVIWFILYFILCFSHFYECFMFRFNNNLYSRHLILLHKTEEAYPIYTLIILIMNHPLFQTKNIYKKGAFAQKTIFFLSRSKYLIKLFKPSSYPFTKIRVISDRCTFIAPLGQNS